jgi:hypothetical protein
MIDRTEFEQRIAAAIIAGQAKLGHVITPAEAQRQAQHIASALPALFSPEQHELG